MLKHLPHTLVCLCGTLEVLLGADLLADILGLWRVSGAIARVVESTYLLWGYRLLGSLVQLLDRLLVEAQILLAANKDDGQALAKVQDFGNPLCHS